MNASQTSLFNSTLAIVQETERSVLTFRSAGTTADAIIRTILLPFPFLQVGMAELFRPVSRWAVLSFGLLIVATFLVPGTAVSAEAKSYIFLGCIYAPLFLVVFAVPSTFAFDSIKDPQVQSLADDIYAKGFDCEEKINVLAENLSSIAERTSARTRALQWLVASVWAFFLYGVNQVNSLAVKIAPERIADIISDNINAFAVYGLATLLSLLVVVGYKKGNDAVFRQLQFAIQELKFRAIGREPVSVCRYNGCPKRRKATICRPLRSRMPERRSNATRTARISFGH